MSERRIGGKYVLERRIAGGAMGAIWVALDSQLQRRVAIKLMAPHRVTSLAARRQFEQEAKAAAQLQHPHVVQIHDYGVDGDKPYIVMELLVGEDLEARLERLGRLTPAAAALLLNQAAKALMAAHTAGIVHRDLKPSNLFLARGDTGEVLKVLDFGLAWLETPGATPLDAQGEMVGTLRYMSPEQMRGQAGVDHRSDLWSLAVVLYRALTGRFPFTSEALGELLHWTPSAPQPRPASVAAELGPEVNAFFERSLELDPARRFQSAHELAAAFSALVDADHPQRAAKILVADDEPDFAELMKLRFRKQLKEGAYQFILAADGEDALVKLREHPDIEVILTDINMPRMDGLTFLSRLGEANTLAKVIIVSAYGDMSNVRMAMNRGAYDFLIKPINLQDLEATLAKTLRHVRELRQLLHSAEENHLLRMFAHSGIVERVLPLLRGPDVVTGEREEATVAFLDVKDFTPVTRQEPPGKVVRRLNANFDVIAPELSSRGGMVDKFVGDAVMAVFRGPGHLERALEACLSARQQLQAMAARAGEQSPYTHGVCIGLDSGELICGSIGARSLNRLDYTVLGDVVNTAARLASWAGKGQLLIRGELAGQVKDSFECTALGERSLPEAPAPMLVYEVQEKACRGSRDTG